MSRLSLALLGPFQATFDGQPVPGLRLNKARALLAYLAVEAARAHPREALATLFWPDQPEAVALSNLRYVLTHLRQALGETAQARSQTIRPSFLLVTRDALQFNLTSDHWLDVQAFRNLLLSEHEPQRAWVDVAPSSVERLDQAVALYRGSFLEGFTVGDSVAFEEWLVLRRDELLTQVNSALQRLAEAHECAGDLARAVACLRRQLQLAPWQEEAHRELMRLLALSDQRSAALAQYEVCKRALREELDVEPDAETTALAAHIREGQFPMRDGIHTGAAQVLAWVSNRTARPDSSPAQAAAEERTPAFVARERELAWLEAHLQATLRGHGRVALIAGDAGSGKTALMSEFVRQAMQRHGDVLVTWGSCNAQTGLGDPYLPFREALQMLTCDVEAKRAGESISAEHARRLWAGLPAVLAALVECGPDLVGSLLPAEVLLARAQALGRGSGRASTIARLEKLLARQTPRPGVAWQQADLFEQVTRVLQYLARRRPVLLVLDDLQWADLGSTALLFHLGRRLAGSHTLILGAYRPDERALGRQGERHPLEPVMNELQRDLGDILLDLGQSEGRQFVDKLLDSEPNRLGEAFREQLYRRTQGHALFTVELLRGLAERGELLKDEAGCWIEGPDLDWARLPARVEAVIAECIARLPQELQDLLTVASVEGEEFTAQVLARVLGRDERRIIHSLSGPLSREHRLVVGQSVQRLGPDRAQRLSTYRFRHSLFQQYLYSRLDPVQREDLHEAVGLVLETVHGAEAGRLAVQLARHFELAGLADKAIAYLLQAGNNALRLSAYAEALAHSDHGLSLLASVPESPARARRELELQLAATEPLLILRGWGSPELARTITRSEELSQEWGETARLLPILGLLAYAAIGRGALKEALDAAERMLALAERASDPAQVATAHYLLSTAHVLRIELRQAQVHAKKAIALYNSLPERPVGSFPGADPLVSCLMWDGWIHRMLGYADQGWRCVQEGLALARRLNHPFTLGFALAMAISTHLFYREYEAALPLIPEAERTVSEKDVGQLRMWLNVILGWMQVRQGQVDTGIALMRQGIDVWRATGTMPVGPLQWHQLIEACREVRCVDVGLSAAAEALTFVEESGLCMLQADLYRLEGELYLLRSQAADESEAEACFVQALEMARRQQARLCELRA
ncbi:MAG: tetratricopeptide repeat protein, partial [Chloroflexi bacterium]|nr:tetratricopeptide repeat protein [Chloroflexota bacterium]